MKGESEMPKLPDRFNHSIDLADRRRAFVVASVVPLYPEAFAAIPLQVLIDEKHDPLWQPAFVLGGVWLHAIEPQS